ncbi:SprT family zinc-dependent metalloprotease [Pantoea sp. 1.19]|uniref:SprT family zinc-dependent metalloprotease n=1 Tax=Pantoea sp. 1.19 TaxID=1925589 RepID=UPI000948AB4F|nr:SprT family zinc-dependent metalloprotease [Pantoea sp. 1.19]
MKTPRVPIALQQAALARLRAQLRLASDTLARPFPEPTLSFQQRGTAAGTAWLEKWEIRLNPTLFLENREAFIAEVIPHELAHLLVWTLYGRVPPHGKAWRWMMEEVLGVPANRTHRFTTDSVRGSHFPWFCACQQHQLTVRRHNKALRGDSQYRCVHCGERLRPGTFPAALLP